MEDELRARMLALQTGEETTSSKVTIVLPDDSYLTQLIEDTISKFESREQPTGLSSAPGGSTQAIQASRNAINSLREQCEPTIQAVKDYDLVAGIDLLGLDYSEANSRATLIEHLNARKEELRSYAKTINNSVRSVQATLTQGDGDSDKVKVKDTDTSMEVESGGMSNINTAIPTSSKAALVQAIEDKLKTRFSQVGLRSYKVTKMRLAILKDFIKNLRDRSTAVTEVVSEFERYNPSGERNSASFALHGDLRDAK